MVLMYVVLVGIRHLFTVTKYILENMMKLFKTTLLASAVAISFGATAELTAMNDASLEDVVGQAGFTISNSFNGTDGIDISIGDTDGVNGGSEGWLVIKDIQPSGSMEIDFEGSDQSINIKNSAATDISFDLGVSTSATAAPANTMAKVQIQLPAGMGTKITAH